MQLKSYDQESVTLIFGQQEAATVMDALGAACGSDPVIHRSSDGSILSLLQKFHAASIGSQQTVRLIFRHQELKDLGNALEAVSIQDNLFDGAEIDEVNNDLWRIRRILYPVDASQRL